MTLLNPERFTIRTGTRTASFSSEEIDWVEAAGNYVKLYTRGSYHLLRETIKNLEQRLDANQFVRVHRSAIVNRDRIREVQPLLHGDCYVILHDGTRVTCSRTYSHRLNVPV